MKGALPNSSRTTAHTKAFGWFANMANATAAWTGRPSAFLAAAAIVVLWGITGPIFNYSDTWQLVINTGTTIVTFLMVFLIQNTQNRDTLALQVKLAELILAIKEADNRIASIENATDAELREAQADVQERSKQ